MKILIFLLVFACFNFTSVFAIDFGGPKPAPIMMPSPSNVDPFNLPWYILYGPQIILGIWIIIFLYYVASQIRYYLKPDTIFSWNGVGKNIISIIFIILGYLLTHFIYSLLISMFIWKIL
ncbi:hypothetical protein K2X92_03575 [Candidatus Gracilibacteria bacterium]|nr:hypothetical protein [Candidatus Gracilibacteria bacterium]